MGNQPFSAKKPRSLPTVAPNQNINETLATWQSQLNPGVANAAPQATPSNFAVTNGRGGLSLSWSPVAGADGYEILKSQNGSFADDLQVIPVNNASQSNFFDSMGGNAQSASYRIRTTSGTASNPQSQRGPESGVVSHTSIDASDTASKPTTQFDNFTTDKTRSLARIGNYGAIKLSPLGKAGGSLIGSGPKGGAGTSAGLPTKNAASFSGIGTGTNSSATMIIAGGGQIIPDVNNPGIIDSTALQGTPVTTAPPTDGQVLQFSASSGVYQPASIIGVGTQANLQAVLPLGLGEIYVAFDTGNLFIGTPGFGAGYMQVADMTQVIEKLQEMIHQLRALTAAVTALDQTAIDSDFQAENFQDQKIGV